jgi:multidrug efflux pump
MTSVATVVGHFPLVIATGAGAAARNSIGIMLVSGMIIGTLFTLFVVPSFYMVIARDRRKHPVAAFEEPPENSEMPAHAAVSAP